ncbi:MAG TPA: VWA domain-containing protein [Vicinamibacterales bacterium]|jgi:Ca-activated chloride channel family protein|nr:VWA domain-containing protein [Vicinamibacterales bacterium]
MTRGKFIALAAATLLFADVLSASAVPSVAQEPTFKSSVDLVRVSATVRDKKGKFVPDLTIRDFTVLDGDQQKPIADFRHDAAGISVALLFDVSGSMEARLGNAREAAQHLLAWLEPRDEAAVYTFDTHLDEVAPFTAGLHVLPDRLSSITPFGATSLNDAIAATAKRVVAQDGRRRAVIVFTDGKDNSSRMKASEVSAAASAIDVPVYVIGIVPSIDNPSADTSTGAREQSSLVGTLEDLADWTGGEAFVVSTPAERSTAARSIVDELRHQYLIAVESSNTPGWHALTIHARDKNLVVKARSGYFAGQSRPVS